MLTGQGSATDVLSEAEVERILANAFASVSLLDRRILVVIPDRTRSAPVPMLFRILCDQLAARAKKLTFLVALGTHPPLSEDVIEALVGMNAGERAARYPGVAVVNHKWDDPDSLRTFGTISKAETAKLTEGRLIREVPVRMNRELDAHDVVLLCGPVFPHEVAGFSGGAKYLLPGIAGPEIIDFSHWLGALCTSMKTIGVRDTPVRRVIHRAAAFVPCDVLCIAMVLDGSALHGLWFGSHEEAFGAAASLSRDLNIVRVEKPFESVLSLPATRYDDLWTAAKAVYKTEPVVADGGEVIVYAPHLREVSFTHGALIDRVGYHVRDYFLGQWDRFRDIPWAILAHSTHVRGAGRYDAARSLEEPRIRVTLATGIPEERCRRIGLGYRDPRSIDPESFPPLVVRQAGEKLYRLESDSSGLG